jgi:1-acyl-sn-glycerol-3-phosphate acyltransferase
VRYPRYPLPWKVAPEVLLSAVMGRKRSFRADALRCLAQGQPEIQVTGGENMPTSAPALLAFNHYSRPGFQAYWIALAVSATVPVEMHWTMTAAWTSDGSFKSEVLAEVSRRLFPRLACAYGFTAMPPMPPRALEAEARARAVRQVLAVARQQPPTVLALAAEGRDIPGGKLGHPPAGAGRFLILLSHLGYPLYPLGVYEADGCLCLNFGPVYDLEISPGLSREKSDSYASEAVMRRIAPLLPEELRGEFAT